MVNLVKIVIFSVYKSKEINFSKKKVTVQTNKKIILKIAAEIQKIWESLAIHVPDRLWAKKWISVTSPVHVIRSVLSGFIGMWFSLWFPLVELFTTLK